VNLIALNFWFQAPFFDKKYNKYSKCYYFYLKKPQIDLYKMDGATRLTKSLKSKLLLWVELMIVFCSSKKGGRSPHVQ